MPRLFILFFCLKELQAFSLRRTHRPLAGLRHHERGFNGVGIPTPVTRQLQRPRSQDCYANPLKEFPPRLTI
ncbi:hypothetical protein BO82DRAFT_159412 [Aspergillus uvarum CBS 121591]|uniref:Secreted protein n=1 Tax=Aspergillus uvarum CBS 121591 TaxID=1448315 RepID=A0A319CRS8_9EURO|nr:hypothetical protein BO82DRAFT_159412 [Aspergillus uvarum CBS 121591]PYH78258.1 hypothetical protein BO82DRAFT_159412 [Aspergillus uvarum CBS 121591]